MGLSDAPPTMKPNAKLHTECEKLSGVEIVEKLQQVALHLADVGPGGGGRRVSRGGHRAMALRLARAPLRVLWPRALPSAMTARRHYTRVSSSGSSSALKRCGGS